MGLTREELLGPDFLPWFAKERTQYLLRYLRTLGLSADDVEDVAQDVMIRIATKRHELQEIDAFDKWWMTIAKRTRYDLARRQKRQANLLRRLIEPEPGLTCDLRIQVSGRIGESFRSFLDQKCENAGLTSPEREVFVRRSIKGESYTCISADLAMGIQACRRHHARATNKLRKLDWTDI